MREHFSDTPNGDRVPLQQQRSSPPDASALRSSEHASISTPEVGEYGWHTAQETMEIYVDRFGPPVGIPDLSVDEFTARRLARSDFAGVVQLRVGDTVPHASLIAEAEKRLAGREPETSMEDDGSIVICFQADDSSEDWWCATHFGYSLGYLAGAVPRVWVNRYRNFTSTDQLESHRNDS